MGRIFRKQKSNIAYTAIIIIIIGLTGKIFGFLRELLLAKYFGTSEIVDVYLMSITIPSLMFGFLPALGVGFTPVYYSIEDVDKNKFLNNILSISMFVSIICIIITMLFSQNIVEFVANGFSKNAKEYTEQFLLVTIWSVLLNTPIQILVSFLNCKGSYISSNLSNLTISIIQALFVVLAANINIILLPYGYLCPFIVQFLWLLSSSCRHGYKPRLIIQFDNSIKKIFILVIPIFISNMLVDLNGFVDKYLASSLPEGRISALNYAFTLRSVLYTVCTTVISTIFYPKVSQLVSMKRDDELAVIINRVMDILILLFIPLQLFCIIFAKDIIKIVLMRGSFSQDSLNLTVYPFIMYMVSLVFISITDFIIKVFYAKKDSLSNLIYGGLNMGLNVFISVLLVRPFGHTGLALGTSLSAIITVPLYVRKISKEIKGLEIRGSVLKMVKAIVSGFVMGIFLIISTDIINFILKNYSTIFLLLRLILQFICSLAIYILGLKILRVHEVKEAFDFVKLKYTNAKNRI